MYPYVCVTTYYLLIIEIYMMENFVFIPSLLSLNYTNKMKWKRCLALTDLYLTFDVTVALLSVILQYLNRVCSTDKVNEDKHYDV